MASKEEIDIMKNNYETGGYGFGDAKKELIDFEDDIISHWENGEITGPIHLSNGNEEELIKI